MSWISSRLYTNKAGAENGARWWRARGYYVRVKKVAGGWKHYRKRK